MSNIDTPYSTPIDLSKATVLITGGASGIGAELTRSFIQHGSKVIICGRRQEALDAAKQKHPDITTYQADVGKEADRIKLAQTVISKHPDINVLVNNAGVQDRTPLKDDCPWSVRQNEIDINCGGPVHLSSLFANYFISKQHAAIIHISSGLAFVPFANAPLYSASKAFLHNFIVSQRWHFEQNTNVQVIEIAPPAVKSELGGDHDFGEPTAEFVDGVMSRLVKGEKEIGYKVSEELRKDDRTTMLKKFDGMTKQMKDHIKPYTKA